MSVNWGTLVASPDGVIDYSRVKSLVAIGLAALGGAVVLAVTLVSLLTDKKVDTAIFGWMTSALVLPLTGGKVAEAISAGKSNGA